MYTYDRAVLRDSHLRDLGCFRIVVPLADGRYPLSSLLSFCRKPLGCDGLEAFLAPLRDLQIPPDVDAPTSPRDFPAAAPPAGDNDMSQERCVLMRMHHWPADLASHCSDH
jgi:hypothetical protein